MKKWKWQIYPHKYWFCYDIQTAKKLQLPHMWYCSVEDYCPYLQYMCTGAHTLEIWTTTSYNTVSRIRQMYAFCSVSKLRYRYICNNYKYVTLSFTVTLKLDYVSSSVLLKFHILKWNSSKFHKQIQIVKPDFWRHQ